MSLVRQLREQAGPTQRLLAQRSGMSQATISQYETGGRNLKLQSLERLADGVGFRVVVSFVPVDDKPNPN